MSNEIKVPLLSNEPNDKQTKKNKLNAKHINIPNAEHLRESKIYVTTEIINIYISRDINSNHTQIAADTIILIKDTEGYYDNWIEMYLPIPGFILNNTYKNSLIKINNHSTTNNNNKFLFNKFNEKESNSNKCIESIKLYFRKKPRLLNLIVLIILGFCELFVIIDIYFDTQVAMELYKSNQLMWFSISCILLIAPYFVAWSVLFQFIRNKIFLQSFNNKICKKIFYKFILFPLFLISPIGLITLILYDFYHTFECFILKPIWFGLTGHKLRTESYEELGYKKLRSVSEIFAETICQSMFNAWILYRTYELEGSTTYNHEGLKIDLNKVLMSFGSSIFSILLYGTMLYIEAKQNGLSLVEFLCVVMTGSFNFVPKLPAIERGKKTGEKVNWIYYKFTNNNIGNIAMAFTSPNAYCDCVKISNYTIGKIHRHSGKFFGKILNTNDVELIFSWRESHIKDWFYIFDIDKSHSFEFDEFARLIVCMNCVNQYYSYHNAIKNGAPQLIYSYNYVIDSVSIDEFIELFNILVSKNNKINTYCIWMLDVLLKVQSSTEWLPVLDHYKPLYYSIQTNNITLLSILSSYNYCDKSQENKIEFDKSVIESIINKKYKLSMTLCENKGIPIVIYINKINYKQINLNDINNDNINIYVTVNIMNCFEYTTREIPINNSNIFDDYILFVIPFQTVDMFRDVKYNSLDFRLSYKFKQERKELEMSEEDEKYFHSKFIGKISININEYRQIYKKQGWSNSQFQQQRNIALSNATSNSNKKMKQFSIQTGDEYYLEEKEDSDMDEMENDILFDESSYNIEINNDENDFLRYKVYFGALNIYEQYGLAYLDEQNHNLLESVDELDRFGDKINKEYVKCKLSYRDDELTQQLHGYMNPKYGTGKIQHNTDFEYEV